MLEPEKVSQELLLGKFKKNYREVREWIECINGDTSNTKIAELIGVNRLWIERRLSGEAKVRKLDIMALDFMISSYKKTVDGKNSSSFYPVPLMDIFQVYTDPTQTKINYGNSNTETRSKKAERTKAGKQ